MIEDTIWNLNIRKSKLIVQDVQDLVLPEQGWVELDDRVEAALLDQIACYLFYLVGGTPVHRG